MQRSDTAQQSRVEQAIAKLKSFGEGDAGVLDVVACGEEAVPALRAVLFERERSGLYQARRHAVEALAALHAYEILIEFLRAQRAISDPVERLGEDAVINAAALALANLRDQQVFELLLMLARRAALTGVIGALGAFGRAEAVPTLINALGEDASRLTAESALSEARARRTRCPAESSYSTTDIWGAGEPCRVAGGGEVQPGCWRKWALPAAHGRLCVP